MRKLVLLVVLVVAGALVARRMRSRAAAQRPLPAPPPTSTPSPPVPRAPVAPAPDPGPPPPTTNGERVVLMSISSLEARGEAVTVEAVVAHVAAGEVDPDEGTMDVLLHRMVGSGLLTGGDGIGPYRLTATGRAALLDGSPARPSTATDAADELSSPATNT